MSLFKYLEDCMSCWRSQRACSSLSTIDELLHFCVLWETHLVDLPPYDALFIGTSLNTFPYCFTWRNVLHCRFLFLLIICISITLKLLNFKAYLLIKHVMPPIMRGHHHKILMHFTLDVTDTSFIRQSSKCASY